MSGSRVGIMWQSVCTESVSAQSEPILRAHRALHLKALGGPRATPRKAFSPESYPPLEHGARPLYQQIALAALICCRMVRRRAALRGTTAANPSASGRSQLVTGRLSNLRYFIARRKAGEARRASVAVTTGRVGGTTAGSPTVSSTWPQRRSVREQEFITHRTDRIDSVRTQSLHIVRDR